MVKTLRQHCFTNEAGEDIWLFTLSNALGTEVLITNYGAIISSFKVKMPDGRFNDIVLGFDDIKEYQGKEYLDGYPWFGAAVGRYANRIKDASFEIDGKRFYLSKNRGNDQLHGGITGFDKKVWQFVASGSSPYPYLQLRYVSDDGEEGFPGKLTVNIRFELDNENQLSYEYTAVTDAPTAINLTHHSYFNLKNGEGDIKDHQLKLYASSMLEQDENLVVTGNLLSVKETLFDFSEFRRIGDGLNELPEYDKSYVADKKGTLMAEVKSATGDISLQVHSSEPIVHFYSGKWIPTVKGKNGITYSAFSGLCLETHKHPNAINIPGFPNTVLRPGEVYSSRTTYKVII